MANNLSQPTSLFSSREGAQSASEGEQKEYAVVCSHLHSPEPHLCLLDHVNCYSAHKRPPLAPWTGPGKPLQSQEV